jgi:hypothetical protein
MEPDDLLCSRNARSQTPLVGRAQWKINQPPSLKRLRASLEGSIRVDQCSFDDRSRNRLTDPHEMGEGKCSLDARAVGIISATHFR